MSLIEMISLVLGVVSTSLAIFSLVISIINERRSQLNYERTRQLLSDIDKRSATTESIVGEHFQKLMNTMLSIVESATTDSNVKTAQIQAQSQQNASKMQEKLMEIFGELAKSGDAEKAKTFIEMFKGIASSGK